MTIADFVASSVHGVVKLFTPTAIVTPTKSGATTRRISRLRAPAWIIALSHNEATCRHLQFSYGVHPVHVSAQPTDWRAFTHEWLDRHGLAKGLVILIQGLNTPYADKASLVEIINYGGRREK